MLTKTVSLSKRIYGYAALLALMNMAGLLGMLAYLGLTGAIDGADLQRAFHALRHEAPAPQAVVAAAPNPEPAGQAVDSPMVDNLDAQAQMDVEILHREAERIKVELEQRLALNKSILLQVQNERDAFRREQELAKRRQEESDKHVKDEGFEKQVEIFQSLSPKVAVQHLLAMNDPDEAAKILMAIDPDRARKIVEAAKRDPELSQMQLILQRVRGIGSVASSAQENVE